jgi:hypothetical protein
MQLIKNNLDNETVGADLSCPPPIYRPRWNFHYPDEKGINIIAPLQWRRKCNVAADWIQLR